MTDVTDEELAAWPLNNGGYDYLPPDDLRRLIAALLASRAEAREAWSRGRSYGQAVCESELAASRAEVERLRERLIEAHNPGIDMDVVRRYREQASYRVDP